MRLSRTVAVALCSALLACDDAATDTCRGGERVSADGHTYCVFGPELVARGDADCPDAIGVRIAVGASVVCADRELDPGDVPSAVCEAIGGCGDAPDAGPIDSGPDASGDARTDAPDADAASPPDDAGPSTADVIAIEGGERHTCALTAAGTVACWGTNASGQRGLESDDPPLAPTLVPGLPGRALDMACGRFHACAVMEDGAVWCWGANDVGQSAPQLGASSVPPSPVAGLTDAREVSAGDGHTCARLGDGTVSCWGDNDFAPGTPVVRDVVPIEGLSDVVEIAAGSYHTCAREHSGRVLCWGSNVFGQLAASSDVPGSLPALEVEGVTAEAIGSGSAHSCAMSGGTLVCWGSNNYAEQARMPPPEGETVRSPVAVPGLEGVLSVAGGGPDLGGGHTCVRRALDVLCFGLNRVGQTTGGGYPIQAMPSAAGLVTHAIGLGARHSCAIETSGRVLCWGDNGDGQLGVDLGDEYFTATPREVLGIP